MVPIKIVEINMTYVGSTGKIMFGIAEAARKAGNTVWTFSPRAYQKKQRERYPDIPFHQYFGSRFENMLHLRLSQLTGFHGCFSFLGMRQLLKALDEIQPDVIHLHNLHNWTICIPALFSYIKRHKIKCVWTLHDCWSFTGQCPYFTISNCDKWKTGCHHCPQLRVYPGAFVDRTKLMWKLKKKWFGSIEEMTIVTPSKWLADLVAESYLRCYPTQVIHNGINLSCFRPLASDYRKQWLKDPQQKYVVLGVAFDWGIRKGLDVFVSLAERLPPQYVIVLVGTNSHVDAMLPERIISIQKTNHQEELARIYSAADVLVNPTREENYPTVNLEAQACGTPVITFATGGSPETIGENCGMVVPVDDVDALLQGIKQMCENKGSYQESCLRHASRQGEGELVCDYLAVYKAAAASVR